MLYIELMKYRSSASCQMHANYKYVSISKHLMYA